MKLLGFIFVLKSYRFWFQRGKQATNHKNENTKEKKNEWEKGACHIH